MYSIVNAYQKIISLIMPPFCAACHAFLAGQQVLCASCAERIKPVIPVHVNITKRYQMTVYAVAAYQDPLRKIIIAKRYSQRTAAVQLATFMNNYLEEYNFACDLFIPIPLHWTRYAWRGYNQAEIIAAYLAKNNNKPLVSCLSRIKRTPLQVSLSIDEREDNVKNVFSLSEHMKDQLKDKHIVLVDDVMTTGATLRAAAKVLAQARPASISAIVAARVI
ncbi:MAG: ComF family protein [Candidatus Babeliales bacterium]